MFFGGCPGAQLDVAWMGLSKKKPAFSGGRNRLEECGKFVVPLFGILISEINHFLDKFFMEHKSRAVTARAARRVILGDSGGVTDPAGGRQEKYFRGLVMGGKGLFVIKGQMRMPVAVPAVF